MRYARSTRGQPQTDVVGLCAAIHEWLDFVVKSIDRVISRRALGQASKNHGISASFRGASARFETTKDRKDFSSWVSVELSESRKLVPTLPTHHWVGNGRHGAAGGCRLEARRVERDRWMLVNTGVASLQELRPTILRGLSSATRTCSSSSGCVLKICPSRQYSDRTDAFPSVNWSSKKLAFAAVVFPVFGLVGLAEQLLLAPPSWCVACAWILFGRKQG